jgi:hypothetical protein
MNPATYVITRSAYTTPTADTCYVQLIAATGYILSLVEFQVTFDGTDSAGPQYNIRLTRQTTAGTGGTAANWAINAMSPNESRANTLTYLQGFTAGAPNMPTETDVYDRAYVHPQRGYMYRPAQPLLVLPTGRIGICGSVGTARASNWRIVVQEIKVA